MNKILQTLAEYVDMIESFQKKLMREINSIWSYISMDLEQAKKFILIRFDSRLLLRG